MLNIGMCGSLVISTNMIVSCRRNMW